MANGRVLIAQTSQTDDYYAEDNVLIQGIRGGTFKEVLPRGGVDQPLVHTSRGAAFGDVNGDGWIDIVVINRDAPAYLLMNKTSDGGFVKLNLLDQHGAPALNATVRFVLGEDAIRREVRTSGGYLSAHEPTLHVGLGHEPRITEIEIQWSNGSKQDVGDILEGETRTIRQMN